MKSCPNCGSNELTARFVAEVAFDYSYGHRGTMLDDPRDIVDELNQTQRPPIMVRCDLCDFEVDGDDLQKLLKEE